MPLHVKKGDLVVVTAGNNRGETGEIITVDRKAMRVIVKGVNVRKRNMKPNQQQPKGFVIEKELSIHISNVSPVVDGKPSRVRLSPSLMVRRFVFQRETIVNCMC